MVADSAAIGDLHDRHPSDDDRRPDFPYSWQDLYELAERLGTRILARLHPVDTANPTNAQRERFRYIRLHDSAADPDTVFARIDCLITDYSSVVYNFMLLRKPIIFSCPDFEEFLENNRSFFYDYNEVTPARTVRSLEELDRQIGDITGNSRALSQWESECESVLRRIQHYQDSNSSARC